MKKVYCINCKEEAQLLKNNKPYCVKHYKEEKTREETNDGF